MRNLKRALSLTLASVMLLGMMVVGTSAASFPDVDDDDNIEAIEVLNAVEVMLGDDRGDFRPDDKVSRNEMAVIMAKLLLGNYAADSYVGVHPFTDVPEWADRYVAACYTNGIVAGRSATIYDGTATVTAVEAAAMMLRALGYEDLSLGAAQWDQPVAAKANEVELFDGMTGNGAAQLTRNEVAKLSLNALKTTMVRTSRSGNDIVLPDGTAFYSARTYTQIESGNAWASAISDAPGVGSGTCTVELGERLYDGNLTLIDSEDSFGRPCSEWEYKGKTVTAADDYNVIFTADTSKSDVEKALKNYKFVTSAKSASTKTTANVTDTVVTHATDGKIMSTNGADAVVFNSGAKTAAEYIADDLTGNGTAVEIYANDSREITKIVVLEYDVTTIRNISESKDGDYTKTNYTLNDGLRGGYVYSDPDKDDQVILHDEVAKDDTVIVLPLADETHIWLADTMNGSQDSYNTGKETIVVDGKTYNVATAMDNVTMDDFTTNSDDEATFYLDLYGNVVKSESVSSKDYAVIDSIRWTSDSTTLDKGHATARLIFTDGTTKDVTLNKLTAKVANATAQGFEQAGAAATGTVSTGANKSSVSDDMTKNSAYVGLIVTYRERSDGKYDLVVKSDAATSKTGSGANGTDLTIKGVPTVGTISGNSKTVYIVRSMDGDDADSYDVYTGYENVPSINLPNTRTGLVSHVDDDGFATYVFISTSKDYVDTNTSTDLVYIFDHTDKSTNKDDDIVYNDAALNGEKQDKGIVAESELFGADGLYEVKIDKDNKVTSATAIITGTPDAKWVKGIVETDAKNGTVKINGKAYNYLDATVYGISDDTISDVTGEFANQGDNVYIKLKSATDNTDKFKIDIMYVVENEDAAQVVPPDANADDVENILTNEGTAQVPASTPVPDNVTVADDQVLVLGGGNSIGGGSGTVTVEEGGKIEVNGNVTGTIATKAGGTVEIKSGTTTLPTITGNGNVVINTDFDTGLSAIKAGATIDKPNDNDGKDASAAGGVALSGSGKVKEYSNTKTMSELAKYTESTTCKIMSFQIGLDSSHDDVIKTYYTTTTVADVAAVKALDSSAWKSPNADSGTGSAEGATITGGSATAEVIDFYVGDKVTAIKIVVTANSTDTVYYFRITR